MRKSLTTEQKLKAYRKRYFITLVALAIFMAGAGSYIYLNYDYLVFKHFIAQNYIYTDTLDELYKKEINTDVGGRYYSYFDNLVISIVTSRIRQENNDRYTYLYTPDRLVKYKQDEEQEAALSEISKLDESTVYFRLSNFSAHSKKFTLDNLPELKKYDKLILDLRGNLGGDIDVMAAISELFLPKGSIIATDRLRLLDWVYKAGKDKALDYDRIIILQDENTASASENMIAALKDNLEHVTLIGDRTYGKGIGQYTLPLRRGFAVKATILLWYTPGNVNIQGVGIEPDIYYKNEDAVSYALGLIS